MEETNTVNEAPSLFTYEAIGKFRSIRRAQKRGLVNAFGVIYPKRPFNNRANTCGRKGKHSRATNETKKYYHELLKSKAESLQ